MTFPRITIEPTTTYYVRCSSCGLLVKYPTTELYASRVKAEHEVWHSARLNSWFSDD